MMTMIPTTESYMLKRWRGEIVILNLQPTVHVEIHSVTYIQKWLDLDRDSQNSSQLAFNTYYMCLRIFSSALLYSLLVEGSRYAISICHRALKLYFYTEKKKITLQVYVGVFLVTAYWGWVRSWWNEEAKTGNIPRNKKKIRVTVPNLKQWRN